MRRFYNKIPTNVFYANLQLLANSKEIFKFKPGIIAKLGNLIISVESPNKVWAQKSLLS